MSSSDVGIPAGLLTFKWAAIAEKFHLTPAQIGDLTDWQIDALFFHPRDKDGALVAPALPKQPPTPESQLATIAQLEGLGLIKPDRAEEMRAEVKTRGEKQG